MSSPLAQNLFTVLPDKTVTYTPYTMLTPFPEAQPPRAPNGEMQNSWFLFLVPFYFG